MDDELDGSCARGTQGHADGDLFAALDDGVGEDSIDADAGKQECDRSEAGDQTQGKTALAERLRNTGLHELKAQLGHAWSGLLNNGAEPGVQCDLTQVGADGKFINEAEDLG